MFSLTHLTHAELHWKQPNLFKMNYELQRDREVLARLHFPTSFKTAALARCADGSWTFERSGFIHYKVRVTSPDVGQPLAVLDYKTNRVETLSGQTYLFKVNFWQTEYTFHTHAGQPWLRMVSKGVLNPALEVKIFPAAVDLPAPSPLPWMILLGWYLVVLAHNDAVVASTTVAATAS